MKRNITIALAIALAVGVSSATRAESASVLLEKAIYTEETVGDVDAAIEIYREIIEADQASRRAVAEAHYRLGVCYLKKGRAQEAIQAFERMTVDYPQQKQLVAKANERLAEARKQLGAREVSRIVKEAVMTISTCAETDPRVQKALATLEGLDEKSAVTQVVAFLHSDTNEIRRSAVYVLWKGPFESIQPAVDDLMKLCSHQESFTRGMAAIALGQRKIESSFQTIADITLKDSSPYARRCGAYALGLMGRAEARPIIETAAKDSEEFVRSNAQAALKMLSGAGSVSAAPRVLRATPPALSNNVSSDLTEITVTFDQPMMDGSWSWTGGGDTFPKITGKIHYDPARRTCTLPVKLEPGKVYWVGINSPSHKNFKTPKRVPAQRYVILFATKSADGTPTPLPEDRLARAKAINAAHEKAADKAPQKKDEGQLGKERDNAIARGDLTAAIDAEMQRVLLRKRTGHAYKDKIGLVSAYQPFIEKHSPSKEELSGELKKVRGYLESHKGDDEYEWRVYYLLSAMSKDLGAPEDAARHLDLALESYPVVDYKNPSKHSKFQHLVNQRAGLIWDSEGADPAVKYALEQLKTNEKLDYFYAPWWERRFEQEDARNELSALMRQVKEAYSERMTQFPEKEALCRKYSAQVTAPTDVEELMRKKTSAKAKGDLIAVIDAEMQRVLVRKKTGHPYKDKIDLVSEYQNFVKEYDGAPSVKVLSETLKKVQDYLGSHEGDDEYEWRLNHLLSAMSKDLDTPEDAARYLDQALESYPALDYEDPSKHSKFQHLVNQRAGLIWDAQGAEAAEKYALEQLKTNEKFEFFFHDWWRLRYEREDSRKRYLPLLKTATEAYVARTKRFPEKDALCKRYVSRVERQIAKIKGE